MIQLLDGPEPVTSRHMLLSVRLVKPLAKSIEAAVEVVVDKQATAAELRQQLAVQFKLPGHAASDLQSGTFQFLLALFCDK